ncbi:MAG: hypothetical protein BWY95_01376 [Bacteroidetes bacterium ADurb.BinA104]|nr:MAG: hypothetical protein BWY95_01376 [Bacteroidetes bacterium ADurb.BinA104]
MSTGKQTEVIAPHKRRGKNHPRGIIYGDSYANAPDSHVHVLLHLAQGLTVEEVSRRTGRSTSTIRNIMSHPPYRSWLDEQQRKFMEGQIEHFLKLSEVKGEMADILLDLIRNTSSKPSDRLAALKYYGELTGMSGKGHSVNHIKAELSVSPPVSGPSDALRLRVMEESSGVNSDVI